MTADMGVIKKLRRRTVRMLPAVAVSAAVVAGVSGAAVGGLAQTKPSAAAGPQPPLVAKPLHRPIRSHVFPLQSPIVAADSRSFADEGVWHVLAAGASGQPLVQGTELTASGTDSTAAVALIHQPGTRFELHPGYQQPGGTWSQPDMLPEGRRQGLVATWNGGFLMYQSGGGFYLDGQQFGSLENGAASEVFYKDGSMTVGVWGRDVAMSPRVASVRQQLKLMVDGDRIADDIDSLFTWGITDGGATYVRRSGVGVTANGDMVYAIGPLMSPRSLATALQKAGAVRAMELDINISWPSFMSYDSSADPLNPRPSKFGNYPRPADRYYSPSSRDFVAVYDRTPPAGSCVGLDGQARGRPGGIGGGADSTAC